MQTTDTSRTVALHGDERQQQRRTHWRFAAMILASMVVMFLLTYTNNLPMIQYAGVSEERLSMSILMGTAMAVVMLGFFWGMFRSVRTNLAILAAALLVSFAGTFLPGDSVLGQDVVDMQDVLPNHFVENAQR